MPSALVVGASGIVGANLVKHLRDIGQWKVVGVVKRQRKNEPKEVVALITVPSLTLRSKINLIHCDLADRDKAHAALKDRLHGITHLFYCGLVQRDDPMQEVRDNLVLFRNAVELTEELAGSSLRHVYLQTGTKWNGVHVGPSKGYISPGKEDHPRIEQPLFYYDLEDWLRGHQRGKNWTWSSARPDIIIGFTSSNVMNFGVTMAVYAALCKELRQPLLFTGGESAYQRLRTFTDVHLLCEAIVWMSTSEHCKNQAFNINNGDTRRWSQLWPRFARYFGLESRASKEDLGKLMTDKEPMWQDIVAKYNLQNYKLEELTTWDFVQFNLAFDWDNLTDMGKARQYGFTGYVSTEKMFDSFFDQLKRERIVPSEFGPTEQRA